MGFSLSVKPVLKINFTKLMGRGSPKPSSFLHHFLKTKGALATGFQ